MSLFIPPTVLFDSNHLFNLAEYRSGRTVNCTLEQENSYRAILSQLMRGELRLVLCPWLALEWLRIPNDDKTMAIKQIKLLGSLIDEINGVLPVLNIVLPSIIMKCEIVQFAQSLGCHFAHPLPAVSHRGLNLSRAVIELAKIDPEIADRQTFPGQLELLETHDYDYDHPATDALLLLSESYNWRITRPRKAAGLDENFISSASKTIEFLTTEKRDNLDRSRWIIDNTGLERIVSHNTLTLTANEIADQANPQNCPGVSLRYSTTLKLLYEKRKHSKTVTGNDAFDLDLATARPYADYFLCERRLASLVRQCSTRYAETTFGNPCELARATD